MGSLWASVDGWKWALGLSWKGLVYWCSSITYPLNLLLASMLKVSLDICHVSTSPLGSWNGSLALGYRARCLQSRTHSLTICCQMVFLEWGSVLLSLVWEPNTCHITTKLACHSISTSFLQPQVNWWTCKLWKWPIPPKL